MRVGFVVGLCLLLTASVGAQEYADIIEPRTGVAFPMSLVPVGGAEAQWLIGTGVRTKTIFGIKVYAIGLYVDPEAARATLKEFAGRTRAALENDRRFRQALLDVNFGMTLRLVMARDVGGPEVAEAFDDALEPRVRRASADRSLTGGVVALEQFRSNFDMTTVPTGTEIVFSCEPGGRFQTSVTGTRRARIESSALCWALFDVYLGDDPISSDARRHLVAGFAGLLAVREAAPAWLLCR